MTDFLFILAKIAAETITLILVSIVMFATLQQGGGRVSGCVPLWEFLLMCLNWTVVAICWWRSYRDNKKLLELLEKETQ